MVQAPRLHAQREEIANALTHGVGVVAAISGGSVLITLAAASGDVRRVIGASAFVAGLIVLYTASTLYHAVQHPRIKARLRVFDHCAIFLLIAGTYTPFTLVSLRGGWGWGLLAAVWMLAVLGIVMKLFFTGRFQRLSTLIYVGMGWLAVVAAGPLAESLPFWSLFWLVAGGISYTAGTFFYHARRPRYAHAVFHGFVLGGSAMHFIAVSLQLL